MLLHSVGVAWLPLVDRGIKSGMLSMSAPTWVCCSTGDNEGWNVTNNSIRTSPKSYGQNREDLQTNGAQTVSSPPKGLQQKSIPTVPTKKTMGPHHRFAPRCSKDTRLQSLSISTHRRRSTYNVSQWTTSKRLHLPFEIPLCFTFFLYQQKGQEAMTSTRLLKTKQTHHKELIPPSPYPGNHRQSTRHQIVHKTRHLMGV